MPLLLFVGALLSGTAAGCGYAWSSLDWQPLPQRSTPHATQSKSGSPSGTTFLAFYSNDPHAVARVELGFFPGSDEAGVVIEVHGVAAPNSFRWALIGGGDDAFAATFPIEGHPWVSPQENQPSYRACGAAAATTGASVIYGGLAGTKFVKSSTAVADAFDGTIITKLKFPSMETKRYGEIYELSLESVGAPTVDDRVYLTSNVMTEIYPECIDLTGVDPDVDAGRLEVQRANFDVTIPRGNTADTATLIQPPEPLVGDATWQIRDRTNLLVRFKDTKLFEQHQTALFASGILGGIAASFLVAALVEVLNWNRGR